MAGTSAGSTPSAATARSVLVLRSCDEHDRAPRADSLRDLGEDRLRRLLERYGASEDLADRVEEIDLLVALGELVRGVLDLERGLEILGDDGKEEPREQRARSLDGRARVRRRARRAADRARARPRHSALTVGLRSAPRAVRRLAQETRRSRATRASTRRARSTAARPAPCIQTAASHCVAVSNAGEDLAPARSFAVQRHAHDAAMRCLDSFDAVHQLPHQEQPAPVLAVDVARRRRVDDATRRDRTPRPRRRLRRRAAPSRLRRARARAWPDRRRCRAGSRWTAPRSARQGR